MRASALEVKIHWVARRIARAQREFGLFTAGDRVLVAFSGGKDSLALLHALPAWARATGTPIEIGAVHVEIEGRPCRREALAAMAAAANVPIHFTSFAPDAAGPGPDGRVTHPCFRCSRLRREALLRLAVAGGWTKVALGHHLDDDAATVLMNLLYRGRVEGLAPVRSYFDGKVVVVRPLILAAEKELAAIGRLLGAAIAPCACSDGRPQPPSSSRERMKAVLDALGRDALAAKRHLQRAGRGAR
ncbi:MAG TPA: ATP-binding protein [Candidatus Krumholzibacteria bacterium]|nr:ATP-binding protein [Candidatus Krumholzibacteria bacterium]HPD72610.1 ATP-binding protein [Candidatus Krumholzibacteria bacterium]HRY40458.1 ATP-binding protein [Candidatus Krumholzibacteria bacterium]